MVKFPTPYLYINFKKGTHDLKTAHTLRPVPKIYTTLVRFVRVIQESEKYLQTAWKTFSIGRENPQHKFEKSLPTLLNRLGWS